MEKATDKLEGPAQQGASASSTKPDGSGSAERSRSGGSGGSRGGQRRKSDSGTAAADTAGSRSRGESKSQESALGSLAARSRSGVGPSPGLMQYAGIVSPDFPSTPNSISQLLSNLPSSFSLEGTEYMSPLSSGIISPLTSNHKLGHKRPISISPLSSSSQLELSNLIRSPPSSSLINCISTSRSDSAGYIGHLSPSLTTPINPSLFPSPHKAPLFSLRNAAHPPPLSVTASFPLGGTSVGRSPEHRAGSSRMAIKQEPVEESGGSQSSRASDSSVLQFNTNSQESGFNSQPRELETLHEEDDILSDDEMQTDPSNSDCSSRYTGEGESQDSKHGILDRKPRRVLHCHYQSLSLSLSLSLLISPSLPASPMNVHTVTHCSHFHTLCRCTTVTLQWRSLITIRVNGQNAMYSVRTWMIWFDTSMQTTSTGMYIKYSNMQFPLNLLQVYYYHM